MEEFKKECLWICSLPTTEQSFGARKSHLQGQVQTDDEKEGGNFSRLMRELHRSSVITRQKSVYKVSAYPGLPFCVRPKMPGLFASGMIKSTYTCRNRRLRRFNPTYKDLARNVAWNPKFTT
jgi:hypothetical protein